MLNYQSNQKIYFCTFGGPTQNLHDAVKRITSQAQEFELFERIFSYTDMDLKSDLNFWTIHKQFIESNSKGYGYWLWKPYLILKSLEQIAQDDILLYCDSGCELNVKGKDHLFKLIEKTNQKLIIGKIKTRNTNPE